MWYETQDIRYKLVGLFEFVHISVLGGPLIL
jgi:hypothetical protein